MMCTVWLIDDLRGLVTAAGAVHILEPSMFTYDVSMTQVVIVEADATGTVAQFESKQLTV